MKKHISLKLLGLTSVVADVSPANKAQLQKYKQKKVYLEPRKILEILTESQKNLDERMERLSRLSHDRVLHVCYEKLFESAASQDDYRQQIFQFLGVPNLDIKSKHSKLTNDNLKDVIENYEEIQQVLTGTPFEKFLG